jgi:hypothetical protein
MAYRERLCNQRGSGAARLRGRTYRCKSRYINVRRENPPPARPPRFTSPTGTSLAATSADLSRYITPERFVVPYHTIAFSQQKLRAALRRASGQEPAFNYGFVVHSRRQSERPSLGLITLHGESLAFNERLLTSLDGLPLWLFGHARITLMPGTTINPSEGGRTKPADRPLASMLMHIATFDTSTGVTQHLVQVEAVVRAESLVQPLLILTPTRPAAWPM